MADVDTLVSGIEYKVHRLIERLQSLQKENDQFRNQIRELTQIREENNQIITDLKQKTIYLQTTRNIEVNEGTVEAKARINELLREIDKCIGLLNR